MVICVASMDIDRFFKPCIFKFEILTNGIRRSHSENVLKTWLDTIIHAYVRDQFYFF